MPFRKQVDLNKTAASVHNYSLDLLRVTAIFLVVVLHVASAQENGTDPCRRYVLQLLGLYSGVCVNCFGMLSGFLGAGKRFNWKNFLNLYIEVYFYSAGISLLLFWTGVIPLKTLIPAFFPILTEQYWYFTAYFAAYCFMPFLYQFTDDLPQPELRKVFFMLIAVFSLIPLLANKDLFKTGIGFSCWWLMILYLFGRILKRDSMGLGKLSGGRCYLLFLLAGIGLMLIQYCAGEISMRCGFGRKTFSNLSGGYTAPGTVLLSFLLFEALVKTPIPEKKSIHVALRYLSCSAFGVYLIHLQLPLWNKVLSPYCAKAGEHLLWWQLPGGIIGFSLILYLSCTMIDLLRQFLFSVAAVAVAKKEE